jgi:hypothetical protein
MITFASVMSAEEEKNDFGQPVRSITLSPKRGFRTVELRATPTPQKTCRPSIKNVTKE